MFDDEAEVPADLLEIFVESDSTSDPESFLQDLSRLTEDLAESNGRESTPDGISS